MLYCSVPYSDSWSVPVPSASTSEDTADLFTVDVTQNMTAAADVTNNFRSVDPTTSENRTSQPNYTWPHRTSSPPTYTEQHLTDNSSDWQINQTLTLGSSWPPSDPSPGDTTVLFNSTQAASSQTEPEVITSTSLERSTQRDFTSDSVVFKETDPGQKRA